MTAEYNPPNSAKCPGSIILLHGLGADGEDLLPLGAQLGGGKWRVVCPNAPVRPVAINGGMSMRAWYDITSADLSGRADKTGVMESAAIVEALLIAEQKRGARRIVLGGFSQGAAMALHCGLRHHCKLGGIIALSGYLLFADSLLQDAADENRQTPIFMAHGDADNVVLPQWARHSKDALAGGGWNITYKEYPAAHSIHPQTLDDINLWMATHKCV